MAELVFERHPVDCGASCITGRFGQWYNIAGRPPYQHRGVDYGVPIGTPVVAPAPGTVVPFNNDGSFGIGVCIHHPGTPWYSLYAHLSSRQVGSGDQVRTGQLLGYSGNTGFVTGPHLHWQVCRSVLFPPDISQSTDPLAMIGSRPAPSAGLEPFIGGEPPTEDEEDDMADSELREAMAKREELRAVASNMDLPTVERAWRLLREAGVIPERKAS